MKNISKTATGLPATEQAADNKVDKIKKYKKKFKEKDDIPVGGKWLERNLKQRDIKGLPPLMPLHKPVKGKIYNNEEILDIAREDSLEYVIGYLPSNQVADAKVRKSWELIKNEIINIKNILYGS